MFADPEERRRLDGLIHPRVGRSLRPGSRTWSAGARRWCWWRCRSCSKPAGRAAFDRVIVVAAPEAVQIRRLRGRDRRGAEEIGGILQAQWPLADKVARADYVVDNGGERRADEATGEKHLGGAEKSA